jgi:hypothetical protein
MWKTSSIFKWIRKFNIEEEREEHAINFANLQGNSDVFLDKMLEIKLRERERQRREFKRICDSCKLRGVELALLG